MAPLIINPPMSQSVSLGSLVNLSCVATGAPQPTIAWFKDSVQITGVNLPFYVINSISVSDRGYYSCSATNNEGSDQSSSVLVNINGKCYYK